MKSNILVTGGSGFIGHHLIKYLSRRGHNVYNIDIASNSSQERIDVKDFENLSKVFKDIKPDVVVHLAAIASIPLCEKNSHECFETNVKGTLNVAILSNRIGSKLIFASSSAVYGIPSLLPTPTSHPTRPVNFYGLSKVLGEQIVRYFAPSSHVIFRIFNVYGPECYRSYVIPDIIRKILAGHNPVTLLGTGQESRDFIYIDDVLEAFRIAIETNVVGTFNLGSGNTYKIKDIALMIRDLMGRQLVTFTFEGKPRPGDFMINWADINDAPLNWKPKIHIKNGLKMTVEWYLRNPNI
jgi:UDP-glucose 4-epimerase